MYPYRSVAENKIITNVNQVVRILVSASNTCGNRLDEDIDNAVTLLKEIKPYLLQLIDGKEYLMESLLKQLISQQLPHPYLLNSFGELQNSINKVITLTVKEPSEETQNKLETLGISEESAELRPVVSEAIDTSDIAPTKEQTKPFAMNFNDAVMSAYPNEKVIKNYEYRSLVIDYYLPDKKTAFILPHNAHRLPKLYRRLLQKDNINVVEISQSELDNPYFLFRILRSLK